jgi:hypothetical protein
LVVKVGLRSMLSLMQARVDWAKEGQAHQLLFLKHMSEAAVRCFTGKASPPRAPQSRRACATKAMPRRVRAFYFLGPARYVRHEGELPMSITWRLDQALPADLGKALAVA